MTLCELIAHTRKLMLRGQGSLRLRKVLPPPHPAGGVGARPVSSCCLAVPSKSSLRSRPSELRSVRPSVPTARAPGCSQSRREAYPTPPVHGPLLPWGPRPHLQPGAEPETGERMPPQESPGRVGGAGGAGCARGAAEEAAGDRRVPARVRHAWLSSPPPPPTSCRLPVAFLPSSRILPELARRGLHPKPPRPSPHLPALPFISR